MDDAKHNQPSLTAVDWSELTEHVPLPVSLSGHVVFDQAGNVSVSDLKGHSPDFIGWQRKAHGAGFPFTPRILGVSELQDLRQEQQAATPIEADSDTQQEVADLLGRAAIRRATDVHLVCEQNACEVYFRIHGDLVRQSPPYERERGLAMMATIMNSMLEHGAGSNKPLEQQDGVINSRNFLPATLESVRIAVSPISTGRWMSQRLLYVDDRRITGDLEARMATLGYLPEHVDAYRDIIDRPQGILVIAGVTNSGKSTTVKHLLESVAAERPWENIVSVEDPVEYTIEGVKQQSVNHVAHNSRAEAFNAHVRFNLRADPDRMLIGELRDRETFDLAITFTRTGHPIATTAHASRWYGMLERSAHELRSESLPDPLAILTQPDTFSGFAYQRLTKRLCPSCSRNARDHLDTIPPKIRESLVRLVGDDLSGVRLINPDGCNAEGCYAGAIDRTVLAEVVPSNAVLMTILYRDGIDAGIRYWRDSMGGQSIYDHARQKLMAGEIDPVVTTGHVGPLDSEITERERREQAATPTSEGES